MNKTKICFIPNFEFEAVIATFVDKDEFEIVPLDTSPQGLLDNYGQEIYGDWCAPLKFFAAMYERAVEEKGVEKIIAISANICSYPLVLGDAQKWIKKEVDYYPIATDELSPSPSFVRSTYSQLHKAFPGLTLKNFTKNVPKAYKRMQMAREIKNSYYANLPLVKNPKLFKTQFHKTRNEFVNADTLQQSEEIKKKWDGCIALDRVRKKPKLRLFISGDMSISLVEFILFDIDVFLASHEVETVQVPGTYYLDQFSKYPKQARDMISGILSNKNNQTKVNSHYALELATLYKIMKAIDQKIDGIVFVRPIMCAPCNNISYILKKENNFDIPILEISYDEHSGLNGFITRLEAFLNIIQER